MADNLARRRLASAIGGLLFAGGFAYLARRSGFARTWMLALLSADTSSAAGSR